MSYLAAEILSLVSRCVCDNQAGLAQYTFLASEKHKRIKDVVKEIESATGDVKALIRTLEKRIADLEGYLYLELVNVFDTNYKYVEEFFKARSNIPPRASVKVIAEGQVVSLLRKPEHFIVDEHLQIGDNTAFESIAKGQSYFCSNNIPLDFQAQKYKNSRLIKNKVLKYVDSRSSKESIDISQEKEYDQEWAECWKGVTLVDNIEQIYPPPKELCYKSTLVLPMSLLTDGLSLEFMRHFQITEKSARAIFGFLCFDHRDANFFSEDIDVNFGYILSDILSLYLIQQFTHTQYSSAYYKAKSIVSSGLSR